MTNDSLNGISQQELAKDAEVLKAAIEKYERDWSDEECPVTPAEHTAYISGWCDARDYYLSLVRQHQNDHIEDNLEMVRSPDIVMSDEAAKNAIVALVEDLIRELDYDCSNWPNILAEDFKIKWRAAIAAMGEGMPPKALKASDAGLGVISASASPASDIAYQVGQIADIPSGYSMLDPGMPTQELRLHMGELTNDEVLVARAAIQWANSCKGGYSVRPPCNWSGGNDYLACSTCHQEYQYQKGESRPACLYAQQREMPVIDETTLFNTIGFGLFAAIKENVPALEIAEWIMKIVQPYLRSPEPVMSRLSYAPENPNEGDLITLDGKTWRLAMPGVGNMKKKD